MALKLVIDLNNKEKHVRLDPKKGPPRTNLNPKILNISKGMGPSNAPDNQEYFGPNGSYTKNMMISTHADIVDENENLLCSLDTLINTAIKDWEFIIKKYKIT